MIGVYFSGTGNTKHCIEYLVKRLDGSGTLYSVEDEKVIKAIKASEEIVFAYPVYYSNLPKIVRDFIVNNAELWQGKKIFIVATMGLFSGDGAGCSARLFKKYGAKVMGGLHIKMPDCIGDVKLLKKSFNENCKIIDNAERKLDLAAEKIKVGKYPKEGLNFFYHLSGLFGQRLYFKHKTKYYYTKTKVDIKKCIQCGLCVSLCPMHNIASESDKLTFNNKCTMCYRCFSNCPKQAITIIGKKVYEQCKFENYRP
ncbi:MAG: EFR1 family ferrodoxin [Clostridia bacterium]|nr:EFR1 family ferrodoxin [Clostridia bacterium]